MHQTRESLAIGAPAEIDRRIERALAVRLELPGHSKEETAEDRLEGHLMDGQPRLAFGAPDPLVRIGEEGRNHLRVPRPHVAAIPVRHRCGLDLDCLGHGRDYTPAVVRCKGILTGVEGRISLGTECTRRIEIPYATEKIAVEAPIPRASVAIGEALNPGRRASPLRASCSSCRIPLNMTPLESRWTRKVGMAIPAGST